MRWRGNKRRVQGGADERESSSASTLGCGLKRHRCSWPLGTRGRRSLQYDIAHQAADEAQNPEDGELSFAASTKPSTLGTVPGAPPRHRVTKANSCRARCSRGLKPPTGRKRVARGRVHVFEPCLPCAPSEARRAGARRGCSWSRWPNRVSTDVGRPLLCLAAGRYSFRLRAQHATCAARGVCLTR